MYHKLSLSILLCSIVATSLTMQRQEVRLSDPQPASLTPPATETDSSPYASSSSSYSAPYSRSAAFSSVNSASLGSLQQHMATQPAADPFVDSEPQLRALLGRAVAAGPVDQHEAKEAAAFARESTVLPGPIPDTKPLDADLQASVLQSCPSRINELVNLWNLNRATGLPVALEAEAAALQQLFKIEQNVFTMIKEVPVPERWAPAIEKLVTSGKITTGEDVTRWTKFLNAPLNSSLTDAVHSTMKQLSSVLPKEKLAEMTAAAMTKGVQVEQDAKVIAATASHLAPAVVQSEAKAVAAISATSQAAQASVEAAAVTKSPIATVAQAAEKISKEEAALAKATSQVTAATHAAPIVAEAEVKASASAQQAAKTATNMAEEVRWGHWADFRGQTVTIDGKEYAKIGDHLYTRHAIEHMVPKGYGEAWLSAKAPDLVKNRAEGRGIPMDIVADVIAHGTAKIEIRNGVERIIKTINEVSVVLEKDKNIVVSVQYKSLKPRA